MGGRGARSTSRGSSWFSPARVRATASGARAPSLAGGARGTGAGKPPRAPRLTGGRRRHGSPRGGGARGNGRAPLPRSLRRGMRVPGGCRAIPRARPQRWAALAAARRGGGALPCTPRQPRPRGPREGPPLGARDRQDHAREEGALGRVRSGSWLELRRSSHTASMRSGAWFRACGRRCGPGSRTIRVAARPGAQADAVIRRLSELPGPPSAEEITIGVPDEGVIPYLAGRLSGHGIHTRYSGGRPLAGTGTFRLLADLASYIEEPTVDAFGSLLRYPVLAEELARRVGRSRGSLGRDCRPLPDAPAPGPDRP